MTTPTQIQSNMNELINKGQQVDNPTLWAVLTDCLIM